MQTFVPPDMILPLRDEWYIEGSLRIMSGGDTLRLNNDFVFIDSLQSISLLSIKINPGDPIILRWQSAKVTPGALKFRYYELAHPDSLKGGTSELKFRASDGKNINPLGSWGGLERSGSITRGVRLGTEGSGGVTSRMHLELSGSPTRDVELQAVLDDRNLPVSSDGSSATLSELDKLLFQIRTPHVTARLGDWDVNWESGYYGSFTRMLKGGDVVVSYPAYGAEVAVAGGNNSYMSMEFFGRDGDLGPYELKDRFGGYGINVAVGSEVVHLDGVELTRGRTADYTIDYSRGTISFNPEISISSFSRIEIEYSYNDGSYPRYLYGVAGNFTTAGDKRLSIKSSSVKEGHDENSPLAFEWNDEWLNAASSAGDNIHGALLSGVDSTGSGKGDYVWGTINMETVLVFSPPDSLGRPTGYLQVQFSQLESGAYLRSYDADIQAYYFVWVGEGEGDWSPVIGLPLPESKTVNDITASYEDDYFNSNLEVAVSEYDRNLLSGKDDQNNSGVAWSWDGLWKALPGGGLSIASRVRHRSVEFTSLGRFTESDYNYKWDLPDQGDTSHSETTVETEIAAVMLEDIHLKTEAGYLEQDKTRAARRGSVRAEWKPDFVTLASEYSLVESDDNLSDLNTSRKRFGISASRKPGLFEPSYSFGNESREINGNTALDGYKYAEHQAGLGIVPSQSQRFDLGFKYRADDDLIGSDAYHASDTRIILFSWQGSKSREANWKISLQRYFQTFTNNPENIVSLSASVETSITPSGLPWKIRSGYDLTTGNSRQTAQVASYVGEGQGSYRREGNRYVYDPDGNFELRQVSTDTLSRTSSVRFNAQVEWKPLKDANGKQPQPFGISRSVSRIEADISTGETDSWQTFLLHPQAYMSTKMLTGKRNLIEELYFLENNPSGNGRLLLGWNESRDRFSAGGETNTGEEIALRIRQRPISVIWLTVEPAWNHRYRRSIIGNELRADVIGIGIDCETRVRLSESDRFEYISGYKYERRKDNVSIVSVDERQLRPAITWYLNGKGSLHLETEWRRLTASSGNAGYDLTGIWSLGDNYTINSGMDYRLGQNLSASFYLRSRWRGERKPSHAASIEFTANL